MDVSQKYTIADAEKTEGHAELINGKMVIENKTTSEHNLVVNDIVFALMSHIKANKGTCKVFSENIALYVNEICNDDSNYFLPDVMVVCEDDSYDDKGVHNTPLFVAEVTSEETRVNDFNTKLDKYKQMKVAEYWIVDLQKKTIFKYLESEGYVPQAFMHPESVSVSVYPGLTIDMTSYM